MAAVLDMPLSIPSISLVDMSSEVLRTGIAVITGAGSGIGEGLAREAAQRGMTVVVADIDDAAAERVAAGLRDGGARAWAERVDVRDPEQVEALAQRVAEVGSAALLVNNAGIEQFGYLWDTPVGHWRRVVDVNISGVFHGIRSFLPRMIAAGTPAHVWNLSSVGAMTSIARQAPYLASKHAVLGLTEALKLDIDEVGAPIHVAAVLPAAVASRIFESAGAVDDDAETAAVDAAEAARRQMLELVPTAQQPAQAAREIFAQAERGEFYLLPEPAYVETIMQRRGAQLARREAPVARQVGPDREPRLRAVETKH
ncbi:SDR family NAD(P)-dependent oxidoreductase [Agromyces sp. NPDC058484]|uniref:SDR family NAD(P)-dependent oxidoreductase n=1 Tax=Agromyces sp. NPDC058484 TaxID=3346524 RepID=UPI00365141BC